MTAVASHPLKSLQAKVAERDHLSADLQAARRQLQDILVRHRGLELQLAQVQQQRRELEGFTFTNLWARATGRHGNDLSEAHETEQALECELATCAEQIDELETRIETGQQHLDALGRIDADYEAALSDAAQQLESGGGNAAAMLRAIDNQLAAVNESLRRCSRADEAAKEAVTTFQEQVSIVATLGRCRVVEGHRALKFVMNTARRGTTNDCVEQAGAALRRCTGRVRSVLESESGDTDLGRLVDELDETAAVMSSDWLSACNESTAGEYLQRLNLLRMLIEKKTVGIQKRATALQANRATLLTAS